MFKKFLFLIVLFNFTITSIDAFSEIIPLKKPIQSKEEKQKKLLVDSLIPLPKPVINKVIEKEEIIKEVQKKSDFDILLPKKKPLITGVKKDKSIKSSKHYSKKDFNLARKAISEMKKGKWDSALKTSKKAKDKTIYNFIQWRHLLTRGNKASFYDYRKFIENNENYPRIGRIKYLAEHKLSTKDISPNKIISWFNSSEPLSGYGKMILGESLILIGDNNNGLKLLKEGWITANLSKSELRFYRKKFKKFLTSEDYIKRADYLAWNNKYWDLKRMLRYLPKDYQLLYTARQILMSNSYGVDTAISKVPAKLKNDAGLNYNRLKWRVKRGRLDSSLDILFNIKNTKEYMVRPDKWWGERSKIARKLIYKKRYEEAYKVTSNNALSKGPELAEAEWLSGWIALSFLNDPILAKDHFIKFYENVSYPISLSRGAYWLGRTYEKLKDKENSKKWYVIGSKYLTTYYGQLSHMKAKPREKFELSELMQIDKNYAESFYRNKIVATVHLLDELNKDKYTKHILRYLANDNIDKGSEVLAAKLATDIGRFDFAIQVAKIASYQKRFHNKYNYPIISTPTKVGGRKIPESALILSIIRQESEFDTSANSRVGAQGLMQLMPYTAKTVAKQAKLSYSKSRLTKSPEYNINLGSFYIAGLILEYDGSYPFSMAAYNAGPKRVKYWKRLNKNPQKKQTDYIDWIELIPFKETRNYVQRVLENYNVYRYVLSQKPIYLKDFFKNNPLY